MKDGEANKDVVRESHITDLQTTYNEYKTAMIQYLFGTGINDDGKFYAAAGMQEKALNAMDTYNDALTRWWDWLKEEGELL